MYQFDLNDLLLFLAIAERRNITKGAEQFGLTEAEAFSRMENLRQCLQVSLFRMSYKGVALTEFGMRVHQAARKIVEEVEELKRSFQPYAKNGSEEWTDSSNYSVTTDFNSVGSCESQFNQLVNTKNRLTPIISTSSHRREISARTEEGRKETNLREEGERSSSHEDELVLISALGHPISRRNKVFFQDVLHYPFVVLNYDTDIHQFVQGKAAKAKKKLSVSARVDVSEDLFGMVAANVGIGIVLQNSLKKFSVSNLSVTRLYDGWAQVRLRAVTLEKGTRANQRLADLKEFLLTRKACI